KRTEPAVRLEMSDGGLVPFQAVAGDGGQVQVAVPDLEGAGQHGMGPVLPFEPLPSRGDPEQVPETSGYRCEDIGRPVTSAIAAARSHPVTPPIRIRSGITRSQARARIASYMASGP